MKKINTFVIPIIRPDFIGKMLETLYKYTEPNFYVFVIDQTEDDEAYLKYNKLTHFWIKSYRNLGFSKGMNTGAILSQTPFITLSNDDLEFLDNRWWQGIMDTFAMVDNIVAVNPNSPKEGAFGYGLTNENTEYWQPKKETGFLRDPFDPECVIPNLMMPQKQEMAYKNFYQTPEGYSMLVNKHPHWQKDTLNDAIAMWCTVFKRNALINDLGLLDERFYPGSGEDYDMNARAYSCGWPIERDSCDPSLHKRMVGTTKSWVWHHWGKSKEIHSKGNSDTLFSSRPYWNRNNELWQNGFDVWGHKDVNGVKTPLKRVPDIFIDEL